MGPRLSGTFAIWDGICWSLELSYEIKPKNFVYMGPRLSGTFVKWDIFLRSVEQNTPLKWDFNAMASEKNANLLNSNEMGKVAIR